MPDDTILIMEVKDKLVFPRFLIGNNFQSYKISVFTASLESRVTEKAPSIKKGPDAQLFRHSLYLNKRVFIVLRQHKFDYTPYCEGHSSGPTRGPRLIGTDHDQKYLRQGYK